MASLTSKINLSEDNENFTIFTPCPIPGTSYSSGGANSILRRVINDLAANDGGINKCLSSALELDPSSYHLGVSGYPVEVVSDGIKFIKYCIDIEIHPNLDTPEPKTLRRVGKLPRAVH